VHQITKANCGQFPVGRRRNGKGPKARNTNINVPSGEQKWRVKEFTKIITIEEIESQVEPQDILAVCSSNSSTISLFLPNFAAIYVTLV